MTERWIAVEDLEAPALYGCLDNSPPGQHRPAYRSPASARLPCRRSISALRVGFVLAQDIRFKDVNRPVLHKLGRSVPEASPVAIIVIETPPILFSLFPEQDVVHPCGREQTIRLFTDELVDGSIDILRFSQWRRWLEQNNDVGGDALLPFDD